ncbi:TetR/AcrR family transcriptional regulator [Polaribacter haliotis]|uniref:TetR/AcrR family transcriptional regulator n=2 Tax=Polaribacter TaxID=52959 RepID=A0A7L8AJ78_9FLAO|nr:MULTISPECIES: TetR family transcriptional regulator C-terminal domain-containing protein [Polaribacter]QNM85811.1 TetR/AcrR family transcriptional regulator [Polaribacter pectinis]QOD62034.1 TetR/AcrR family transcriptional regulator [Polaribacter haliotis]
MAKKKKVSKLDILTLYMDFVVEHQNKPLDVEDFCETVKIETTSFHKHFKSLKKVEKTVFKELFNNSLEVLNESEEFVSFDKKNQLLSLYFTFFENLNLNREYIVIVLKGCKNKIKSFSTFSDLKKEFIQFVNHLEISESILPIDGLEKAQRKFVGESAWIQLFLTIKFWLDDTSESFEKTDILIEKSINTSFELLENNFLKNALDLGKFIYKEKFQKE